MLQHQAPETPVHLAFLELMTPSLPEVIAQLAAEGVPNAQVIP
ncbi:MAG: sirohydrochlorin chelatase, partial [Yersinia sp. (in: enterobacteria)]